MIFKRSIVSNRYLAGRSRYRKIEIDNKITSIYYITEIRLRSGRRPVLHQIDSKLRNTDWNVLAISIPIALRIDYHIFTLRTRKSRP